MHGVFAGIERSGKHRASLHLLSVDRDLPYSNRRNLQHRWHYGKWYIDGRFFHTQKDDGIRVRRREHIYSNRRKFRSLIILESSLLTLFTGPFLQIGRA